MNHSKLQQYMYSEADIALQIHTAIHVLNTVSADFEHIKGYQKTETLIALLPWKSQLNTIYNKIASKDLDQAINNFYNILILLANNITLCTNNITITQHLTSRNL